MSQQSDNPAIMAKSDVPCLSTWQLKCLEENWAIMPQSEELILFESVSRNWVNVTILIYFTSNFPLENSHPTSRQKKQTYITFYLVSKSLMTIRNSITFLFFLFCNKSKPKVYFLQISSFNRYLLWI